MYYSINESAAKLAHEMSSMSDYKANSTTSVYRAHVDDAYAIVEQIKAKRPQETERAEALADRYAKRMAEYYNKESYIGTKCPSVLISGAGNFPTRKKEKQIAAWKKNHDFYVDTQGILDKLRGILHNNAIYSDDADAIERIEEKLEGLKELQATMRDANKFIRMKDEAKGNEGLREMGYSDSDIIELRKPDFCGRVGYPSYALQNNNQNIHRLEGRLKELKAAKETETTETEHDGFTLVENSEAMRIQFLFDDKPDEEIRNILKKYAFRWSPRQGAWQRQLNENGRRAARWAIEDMENLKSPCKSSENAL